MSKLVKINASDYGLEEKKAQQIESAFKPMLEKMTELEKEYNDVIKLPIDNQTTGSIAKELRLKYVKVRTGTALIHKELKAFYLAGGRFVDGWKNTQLFASQGIEKKLSEIENHFEILERERMRKLQDERSLKLESFEVDYIPANLGQMTDDIWKNYISGVKLNFEAQKAAEKKAADERIAAEKAEIAERKRIADENEKLKKEAVEREKAAKIEADKRAKEEEAERKIREEKERNERAAYEAKLKSEREEKQRVIDELKAKEDAERKAEADRLAMIESDLKKGDAAKVTDLINDLSGLKTKYAFKSKKSQKMYADVSNLIDKVINHIKS